MLSEEEIEKKMDVIKDAEIEQRENSPTGETPEERDERLKDDSKGFFEGNKGFMMKNKYKLGNVTYYPTSKACLRGMKTSL